MAALAGGLVFGRAAAAPREGGGIPPALSVDVASLKAMGINPEMLVSLRLGEKADRIVLAEHRPGKDSLLHVLNGKGSHEYALNVPSPQLVDFSLDGSGKAFLVGSVGTRFYRADLAAKKAKLILSAAPERPGFRALTPVTIINSPEGPAVYGVFYQDEKRTQDLGFATVSDDGRASPLMSTLAWERRFGQVLSYAPHPKFKSCLVVHQDPAKLEPGKNKTQRLSYVTTAGEARELDSGDRISGASWAVDSELLVYVRKRGEVSELMARALSQSEPIVLGQGSYFSPRFLSGRKLVVSSIEGKSDQAVWAIDVPAGQPVRLDLPTDAVIYSTDPTGSALAAWGPWGIKVFQFGS